MSQSEAVLQNSPSFVVLSSDNLKIKLPICDATLGPKVIDVTGLAKDKLFTYDPGFLATAACTSKITFIDGDEGILLYRGYPIEQLAEKSEFIEVAYLLLFGNLPTHEQKFLFSKEINNHTMVHEQLHKFFHGFRRDAHPMAIMLGVVGALSAFYSGLDIHNAEHRKLAAVRLIAKIPTIAAMAYRYSVGLPFIYPKNDFSYSENFLHMLFSVPTEKASPPSRALSKALDKIFMLHADHEQNASTATVRLAGSTGANPYACISAGIAALWGSLHGGANEACLNMLLEIGDLSHIDAYIEKAKDPRDPFRLMGFGHRIYKNHDPRAVVIKKICYDVLNETGKMQDPLFKLALELERRALEDPYFIERKLYPNVDFYSGIILSALGIPRNMFTVIFVVARTIGWVSHLEEMMSDPHQRIARPRQLYRGKRPRDYVPIEDRASFK